MEHLLAALKRPISARAKAFLQERGDKEWLQKLTVMKSGEPVFRFWQTGGGFDHNVWNERPIQEVIRYIHQNPVRRGLVEDACEWEWSSARFWEGKTDFRLKMDPLETW